MKITVSCFKKTSKDYNSEGWGYSVEADCELANMQSVTKDLKTFIEKQYSNATLEENSKPYAPPAQKAVAALVNSIQSKPPQFTDANPWNVISQKQVGFLFVKAREAGKQEELKKKYMEMGIISTKEKNNMTKAQLKEIKEWLGLT